MEKLVLEELEFHAFHGVMPEENKIGAKYLVTAIIKADLSKAMISDDISDTVNYQVIFDLIKEEMKIKSKLIEHVGGRIVNRILDDCSKVESIELTITKMAPPVNGNMPRASFITKKTRNER
ncbi:MAG: dihydroneopterin aldolase [Bacteroidales bacterium]|nr:dihydroneopterin aldolase [Bacteroidales bacterium]